LFAETQDVGRRAIEIELSPPATLALASRPRWPRPSQSPSVEL